MSMRKKTFVSEEYYHLYNRGNSKQKIFHDRKDEERFVKILYLANSKNAFKFRDVENAIYEVDRGQRLVSIGAYCLMPNHFHLLIKELDENGISRFMQRLTTAYSMYYNTKYKRVGALFEGRFRSEHLYNDNYLKYMFSYIHLNPLKLIESDWKNHRIKNKSRALRFLEEYKLSSYADYGGEERSEGLIINVDDFPKYFPTKQDFHKEILDWITTDPR